MALVPIWLRGVSNWSEKLIGSGRCSTSTASQFRPPPPIQIFPLLRRR
jgi:hypothetical protein